MERDERKERKKRKKKKRKRKKSFSTTSIVIYSKMACWKASFLSSLSAASFFKTLATVISKNFSKFLNYTSKYSKFYTFQKFF